MESLLRSHQGSLGDFHVIEKAMPGELFRGTVMSFPMNALSLSALKPGNHLPWDVPTTCLCLDHPKKDLVIITEGEALGD